jgi:hypothetical protein
MWIIFCMFLLVIYADMCTCVIKMIANDMIILRILINSLKFAKTLNFDGLLVNHVGNEWINYTLKQKLLSCFNKANDFLRQGPNIQTF